MHEQITKTFEHLLHLRSKYHSIDTLISTPKKFRSFYRISRDKLEKYRKHLTDENQRSSIEENQQTNMIPIIKVLADNVIHQRTISTQTTVSKQMNSSTDFIHSSIDTLSNISKKISESNISTDLSSDFSSFSDPSNQTITKSSNPSSIATSEISMKTFSNQIQSDKSIDHSPKPQSTTGRVYIRSIVRHMLSDDTSETVLNY